jgi:hypothetical protein
MIINQLKVELRASPIGVINSSDPCFTTQIEISMKANNNPIVSISPVVNKRGIQKKKKEKGKKGRNPMTTKLLGQNSQSARNKMVVGA